QRSRKNSRLRNVQVLTDLLREKIDDLAMARNRGRLLRATIDVNGVIAAFAQEFTAVVFKMSNQVTPLHPVASGSRRTSAPRNDSSANSRFACKTISTASFKF